MADLQTDQSIARGGGRVPEEATGCAMAGILGIGADSAATRI
jgi:hypothetical protein